MGGFYCESPDLLARRFLSITKAISMLDPTVVILMSDEFANAARPFADQKVFLVFLRSNFRRNSDIFACLLSR